MKKLFVSLLLLSGVAAMASLAFASATEDGTLANDGIRLVTKQALMSKAAKLRTSVTVGDTTYVGYTPGKFNSAKNWWSIGAGFSPGNSNTPAFRRAPLQGGMWDFETTTNPAQWGVDSLQGWWPVREAFNLGNGAVRADWLRPNVAQEAGNNANYVLNVANGPSKRTFGVVGVWHRDPGSANPGVTPDSVGWSPIGGSFSAWMGLRRHGDNTVVDPITKNAFTEDMLSYSISGSASPQGSDNHFPGYGNQMDQMLYRDIQVPTGSDLTISYSYKLRMSTGFNTTAAGRVGWFEKDPLQVTAGPSNQAVGNFISSSDAGDATCPRDSFEVYVGAPTGGTFLASDGNTYPIFDPQRRWFSEVVRANEGLYKEIDQDTGYVPLANKTVTLTNASLSTILAASGGKVRLVFRVHTNRGFDDQGSSYNSAYQGAAVVDNVTYSTSGGASPAGWGTFEAVNSIDNNTAVDPLDAWKSTGKPPSIYPHVDPLANLVYDDLCGQPGDASRICDLAGNVMTMGDHDHSERLVEQTAGTVDHEVKMHIWSPTIQLRSDGGSWPNPIGLVNPTPGDDQMDPFPSEEYYLDTDIYMGVFDLRGKGMCWSFTTKTYPAIDRGGKPVWGNMRGIPYLIFNPDQQCVRDFIDHNLLGNSLVAFSSTLAENPTFADSMQITFETISECYRFSVTTSCGVGDGAYFDNIALMIVDGVPAPIGAAIWDLYHDAFPANETAGLPAFAAKFDTTAAHVKTGVNTAPQNGLLRFDVPGDSVAVAVSQGTGSVRVDLVFRILPGPGNYATIGRPDISTLVKNPADPLRTPIGAANVASSNFWESYLADNGAYGTGGNGTTGPGHPGHVWNPNIWNSARCDTAEAAGLFALQGKGVLGGPADPKLFQTTYHESELGIAPDPALSDPFPLGLRTGIGIARHRCYVASSGAATVDIDCVHDAPNSGPNYDLSYVVGHGWDGTNTTVEGTKIIPDGLLTPGSSVEYFLRKQDSANGIGIASLSGMCPDTTIIEPQNSEGSTDAHRWQYFSVLPDRWKSASYKHPVFGTTGLGEACMLVYDGNDRRGNEWRWVGIADTIGSTAPQKYGAHNGWHATYTQNVVGEHPDHATFVYVNGGIPGTTWDLYNQKASESVSTNAGSIGARLAFKDPANTQINGKSSKIAPTPEMMNAFYKMMIYFSGDLNSSVLGPYSNRTQNDVQFLTDWLRAGQTNPLSPPDRGFWAMGDGFVESNTVEGTGSAQDVFNTDVLGVTLVNPSYSLASGNTEAWPDLVPVAALTAPQPQDIFGVQNICLWTNDVIDRAPGALAAETSELSQYENPGPGPFLSGVKKAWSSTNPYIALVDGWDLDHLASRFGNDHKGAIRYFNEVLTNVFGSICPLTGSALIPLAVPTFDNARQFVDLAGTPMRNGGKAHIHFGLTERKPVQIVVYDVSGRAIREVANRTFEAGQHELLWDGTDNSGRPVARGVYFTQVKLGADKTAKKVIVLN